MLNLSKGATMSYYDYLRGPTPEPVDGDLEIAMDAERIVERRYEPKPRGVGGRGWTKPALWIVERSWSIESANAPKERA